jgi:hypothetical protein
MVVIVVIVDSVNLLINLQKGDENAAITGSRGRDGKVGDANNMWTAGYLLTRNAQGCAGIAK